MNNKIVIITFLVIIFIISCDIFDNPLDPESNAYLPSHSIIYSINGADSGTVPDRSTYQEGTEITVSDNTGSLVKDTFFFGCWNTFADGSGTNYVPGDTLTIGTTDITLYARFIQGYRVIYDSNGADSGIVPDSSNYHLTDSQITIADNKEPLIKDTFFFDGWNTKVDGTGTDYVSGESIIIGTSDMTLYAEFIQGYRLTYNSNGANSGTVPDSSNYHLEGTELSISDNKETLTKDIFILNGWNTKEDGTGTDYIPGDSIVIGTSDITLYAKFIQGYRVSYNSNGADSGVVPESTNYMLEGTEIMVSDNTGSLVKETLFFSGWNTKADGTGTDYLSGDTLTIGTTDIILYANFIQGYRVSYNSYGADSGVVPESTNYQLEGGEVIVSDNTGSLVKHSYIFNGWNTELDGTGTDYLSGDTLTIGTSDIILYAMFIQGYKVTYNLNGSDSGTVPDSSNYHLEGAEVIVSDNTGSLVKETFFFGCWNTESDGTGTDYIPGDTLTIGTTDIILYAKFIQGYRVTYDSNGADSGIVPDSPNYHLEGAEVIVSDNTGNIVKNTFFWDGWNTKADGTGADYVAGESIFIGTSDLTLYPKFLQGYRVIYDSNGAESGTIPDSSSYELEGSEITVSSNTGNLVKDSYIFRGWYNDSDGLVTNYNAGDLLTILTSDIIFYAVFTEPTVGDLGPSGGYIFYDDEYDGVDDNPTFRYLETAPADVSGTKSWGTYNLAVPGATGVYIGDGMQNTIDIISGDSSTTNAAHACVDYSVENNGVTYSDWFLPSKYELDAIYDNLKVNDLGGFNESQYWSSTQQPNRNAWLQNFLVGTGSQVSVTKSSSNYVRPIRAFNSFTKESYSVSYIVDFENYENNPVPISVDFLSEITIPDVSESVKKKSVFLGWNTKVDGSGTYYSPGDKLTISMYEYTFFAMFSELVVGEIGPSGGYIIYDDETDGVDDIPGFRYIEVAMNDLIDTSYWGSDYFTITGGDGEIVGAGLQNTIDIIASDPLDNKIADLCFNYSTNYFGITFDDWYLPSKDSIDLMYTILRPYGLGNFNSTGNYWSSTEATERTAWIKFFSSGGWASGSKDSVGGLIRPVRYF